MPDQHEPHTETITVHPTLVRPHVVTLPVEPTIAITHGNATCSMFTDDMDAEAVSMPPIRRAVTVARLRALADLIEGGAE